MIEASGLRPGRELEALGAKPEVIESLGANAVVGRDGIHAFRQGMIDAARLLQGDLKPDELSTPDEVITTTGYSIGFNANSAIIREKQSVEAQRMAA